MSAPGNYQLSVWACRRADGAPLQTWKARASWGSPEKTIEGEPCASDTLAIVDAVARMKAQEESEP